jgi:hypothetical protein
MPFRVVAKDDDKQLIMIDGQGPCSLPDGAVLDIDPSTQFMLSHNQWDTIWHWPDRAGETYKQIVDRFVDAHAEGDVVTGYLGSYLMDFHFIEPRPDRAMAFKLSLGAKDTWHLVHAQPVAAVADDGSRLLLEYDPAVSADRWINSGPAAPLRVEMVSYRWALLYGRTVLNWRDFQRTA